MILDTSAVVALLLAESDREALLEKLNRAEACGIGAPTLVECHAVLLARLPFDPMGLLSRFLAEFEVVTIPFTDAHWREASSAYRRFGKGRHPASLNFGDCLSYATARVARQPLLCKGADFPQTDLTLA